MTLLTSISIFYHTDTATISELLWDKGEKANKRRTAMMRTGTMRRRSGGGGSGGTTSGSTRRNRVRIINTITDLTLKNLIINLKQWLSSLILFF
ncbi:hypothetical protein PanWU01x14_010710 [Parasponia andersonii]|uniref:Uncharacterized protein n=1 Tax=Parasponia andersonii TaxID=3476 RepID=A0A2P5E2S1_PARAD|nr:hypothetical protein PanWU01x14_010710 [Parasponia andersonii]